MLDPVTSHDLDLRSIPPECGYGPDDYANVMADLLPVGAVWPRDADSVQQRVIGALAVEWARVSAAICELLAEAFPCGALQALPDWERIAGLPDPCTGPLETIQQRQAAVCAAFAARGGSSIAYFEDLAARLGFIVHIQTFQPFRASVSRAGDPLFSEQWAHVWLVQVEGGTQVIYFRASVSAAGEPLATWGNKLLECVFERYKPAHTVLLWAFREND